MTQAIQGLDAFYLRDTAEMQITLPTGEPFTVPTGPVDAEGKPAAEPVTITLLRQSSELVAKYLRDKAQRLATEHGGDAPKVDPGENMLNIAVFCTQSWKNLYLGTEQLECTPENVRKLYTDPRLSWLYQQVVVHIAKADNYLGN
jgi:hypothetical protein